ncbi:MBOAT family protein [Diaporthe amygdali]|uniref:MBOAT family protein n=1 Tax=Phomopsis amygdali TaxID=1214568 RepID=UPI0022FDB792|nr:MBOAT family protein [Diaporthe amygdali]KAJ0119110.1 MBOAT family protein [Diaporthe amygdali]
MAVNGAAGSADLRTQEDTVHNKSTEETYFTRNTSPRALREALQLANSGKISTPSESASEEDYDEQSQKPIAVLRLNRKREKNQAAAHPTSGSKSKASEGTSEVATPSSASSENGTLEDVASLRGAKVYTIASDDKELREILRRGMQRAKEPESGKKRKGRFSDYVFTRKFSTFDRQNVAAANSPFHGFFTLFWIAIAMLLLKIGADNWKNTGSPLGTNDIMKHMFKRDVVVLLISDGVLCGLTGVSWILQLLVQKGYMDWDSSGWILQNVWQTTFIGSTIGWTQLRQWPWSHTVFFVMHSLVMLMKQHSYAFYNGYLSSVYKKRAELLKKLKQLEHVEAVKSPSQTKPTASSISTDHLAHRPSRHDVRQRRQSLHSGCETFSQDLEGIEEAIKSSQPLDLEQIHVFEQIIKWEIDGLTEELQGKATTAERAYPNNITYQNHYEYIVFPTLVYELEYPRSERIDWGYVAEKAVATFGVIFVMMMVSQAFIYPVVMKTVHMKESGMSLVERFKEFPWLLSDLIFPFMMEYLLTWYLIWEAILNLLGELTYFADREFYSDWWNSISWDQFARDWNRPVHNFLLRHVYHSSISAMKVNKHTATLFTFFLSALVHELVMWCIFKKLRGYLLFMQMLQLPLVQLSRTKWMKGRKTLGNINFWLGIFTGPSVLCSLYLIFSAQHHNLLPPIVHQRTASPLHPDKMSRGGTTLYVTGFSHGTRARDLAYEFERRPRPRVEVFAMYTHRRVVPTVVPCFRPAPIVPPSIERSAMTKRFQTNTRGFAPGKSPDNGIHPSLRRYLDAATTRSQISRQPFYGRLVRCDIPAPRSASSRLFAFVEYEDRRDADDAYHDMHNKRIGRDDILKIEWARTPPSASWRFDSGRDRDRRPPRSPRRRTPSPRRARDYSPRKDDRRDRDRYDDRDRRDTRDRSRSPDRRDRDDRERDDRDDRDRRENGANGDDRKPLDSPPPVHDDLDTAE